VYECAVRSEGVSQQTVMGEDGVGWMDGEVVSVGTVISD
jgi:hypothetical protein